MKRTTKAAILAATISVLGCSDGGEGKAEAAPAGGVYALVESPDGRHVARLHSDGAAELLLWIPDTAGAVLLDGSAVQYVDSGRLVSVSLVDGSRETYDPAPIDIRPLSPLGLSR